MSSSDANSPMPAETAEPSTIDMALEVVQLPSPTWIERSASMKV